VPQIEVTFDIDANGIVNVSAKDKGTGKEHQIRIQASGGLSDADIEKMIKEAEAHAEADKKRRAVVEAKNQGESLIHTSEQSLKDYGDKVSEEDRTAIADAIAALKAAVEAEEPDAEDIQAKSQTLDGSVDEARPGDVRAEPGRRRVRAMVPKAEDERSSMQTSRKSRTTTIREVGLKKPEGRLRPYLASGVSSSLSARLEKLTSRGGIRMLDRKRLKTHYPDPSCRLEIFSASDYISPI
jgi:hypothetical protein